MRPPSNVRPLVGREPPGDVVEDWVAVAAALKVRMAVCRVSQRELAELSRVSVATLRVLQRGTGSRRASNATLAAVSRALGWPDDHLVQVLLGEPVDTGAPSPRCAPSNVPEVRAVAETSVAGMAELVRVLRRIDRRLAAIARQLPEPPTTRSPS